MDFSQRSKTHDAETSRLMPNMPEPCSKETLLALLDDIRHHVEHDDSFEGYLEYTMPWSTEIGDPVTDPPDVRFRVKAGYRIGNSQGQGGFRTIGRIGQSDETRTHDT